jgi:hypothetical protein
MGTAKRALSATEVLLVFPAVLFMTALFMRDVQPPDYEPARLPNGSSPGTRRGPASDSGYY